MLHPQYGRYHIAYLATPARAGHTPLRLFLEAEWARAFTFKFLSRYDS